MYQKHLKRLEKKKQKNEDKLFVGNTFDDRIQIL